MIKLTLREKERIVTRSSSIHTERQQKNAKWYGEKMLRYISMMYEKKI